MGLNKAGLKDAILEIMDELATREDDPATAREDFATMLSNAIDTFVKTGTVTVSVTTTGTASSQTGTGTGGIT